MTSAQGDLAARVRRLEDRQELWDVISKYCVYADDRDFDALSGLLSDDVRFQSPGGWLDGKTDVMGYFTTRFPSYGPGFHYPHSQIVDFDDEDHAHGFVTSHAEMSIDGQTLWTAYRYVDRYVRHDGAWLIAERAISALYLVPFSELATALGDPLRRRWPGVEPTATELPESLASWQAFHAGSAP